MKLAARLRAASRGGAVVPSAPISLVQEVVKHTTTGSTATLVATVGAGITTTVGNMLILRFAGNQLPTAVVDSKGNTWSVDNVGSSTPIPALAHTLLTTPIVTGDTITLTMAGATSFHVFVVDEWHGPVAYGGGSAQKTPGGASTARQTNSVSAGAGALVIGLWSVPGVEAAWVPDTSGAGFASFTTPTIVLAGGSNTLEGEHKVDSGSGGTYSPDATGTSLNYRGIAAVYV